MARIDLDLAHAYMANPQSDADYALLPLRMRFDDGGAYGLLQAYASRHRVTTLAVATVIVKQLADPRRDASDPSGAMESIVASLAQQPDTGATAVT